MLLCERVFTIFLCVGEYVLTEIISFKITRCKLLEVTGPLVPLEILSHESESTLYVWTTRENRMDIFRSLSATLLALTEEGSNFDYKCIYRRTAWMGNTFLGLEVYKWISSSLQKYVNWVSFFTKKNIWMGKIWKLVYELVQLSPWEVNLWVYF